MLNLQCNLKETPKLGGANKEDQQHAEKTEKEKILLSHYQPNLRPRSQTEQNFIQQPVHIPFQWLLSQKALRMSSRKRMAHKKVLVNNLSIFTM